MSAAVVDDEIFTAHRSPGHPERPDRVRAIRAAIAPLIAARNIPVLSPDPASEEQIATVHDERLIAAVDAMALSGGGWFDADTYCTALSAAAARMAAGAAITAVDAAVKGTHTVALMRPPGHHACPSVAMGFCLFNNIAIGARHAQTAHGITRVAIVDIDVHHGNGTHDMFYDDGDVLYTSIHESPFYPGTGAVSERGAGEGEGATLNVPVPAGTDGDAWLKHLDETVLPRVAAHSPEIILVSAGFDAHEADPLADLGLTEATYAAVADRLSTLAAATGAGTVWCLEGGYDLDALGASMAAVLEVLAA